MCAYHINGVLLWHCGSPNYPKSVISTPTVPYNAPLVWYAHFIFYSVANYRGLHIHNTLYNIYRQIHFYICTVAS